MHELVEPGPVIRFHVEVSDLVTFTEYHMLHSPAVRKSRAFVRWIFTATPLGFFGSMGIKIAPHRPLWGLLALAAGVGAAWIVHRTYPKWNARLTRRPLERMYTEGKNDGILGRQSLQITESTLVHETAVSTSTFRLESIERIVATDTHLFVYTAGANALVVPRRTAEGDVAAFEHALAARVAAARSEGVQKRDPATP